MYVHQSGLQTTLTAREIEAAVSRVATEIRRDYHDTFPLLIGVLKGSFIFMADLVRKLDFPVEIDFIKLSSYGSNQKTSGKVKVVHGLNAKVKGRHVIIVEDIVDTGITTSFLMEYLSKKKTATVRLCSLTDKPSRRQVEVKIDYVGLTVPDKFLVGYGLDCNEQYRHLPDICILEGDD